MGSVKDIELRVIPASIAGPFVKRHHYSGKIVNNSQLHFGAFLDGGLHGVMSYGPSMDKRKIQSLVTGTGWNEFLELNRMAFDDYLPRNSESFCLGISLRLIKKKAPQIKWVVSFADGAQCGDGTIYRAANFILTGIRENVSILEFPDGGRICKMTVTAEPNNIFLRRQSEALGVPFKARRVSEWVALGAKFVPGFMLRYIYFLDKSYRARLTVPEIPFSRIDELGAGMYKGKQVTRESRRAAALNSQQKQENSHGA